MIEETMIKTHLIVTDIHEEYSIRWCGKILDTNPLIENGLPVFAVIGSLGRIELNTIDMSRIEDCAKRLTQPKGRQAVTIDKAYIYIKEINGNEKMLGVLTHKHIKSYAPMHDKVGYSSGG